MIGRLESDRQSALAGGQRAGQAEKEGARDNRMKNRGFAVERCGESEVRAHPDGAGQAIPEEREKAGPHPYPPPAGEEGRSSPGQDQLRRLRWRCRRGLLELDLWLERFASSQMSRLSQAECDALEALLKESDVDLLAWLEGRQKAPPNHAQMIERILASGRFHIRALQSGQE